MYVGNYTVTFCSQVPLLDRLGAVSCTFIQSLQIPWNCGHGPHIGASAFRTFRTIYSLWHFQTLGLGQHQKNVSCRFRFPTSWYSSKHRTLASVFSLSIELNDLLGAGIAFRVNWTSPEEAFCTSETSINRTRVNNSRDTMRVWRSVSGLVVVSSC